MRRRQIRPEILQLLHDVEDCLAVSTGLHILEVDDCIAIEVNYPIFRLLRHSGDDNLGHGLNVLSASDAGLHEELATVFAQTRAGLPFRGFVALDIAVRGESLEGKDLDNLAHSILIPLEETLCVRRGTVLGYRVYTAAGQPEGVQVRIIDHSRLLDLNATLHEIELNPPLMDRLEEWSRGLEERQNEDG